MSKSDKTKADTDDGITLMVSGKERLFDIDDPQLPDWIKDEQATPW